ncbi:MAG: hypothetical protein Q7S98_05685 [Deltaproteobacteria bacterium]|nr:hypothetical protein [Deltaproteobacteria bacterium]
MKPRFLMIVGMILAAALSRLIPHPLNFAPIVAMALFGGACFSKKQTALIVTFGALLLSDLLLGFYPDVLVVYASYLLIIGLGTLLKNRRSPLPVAAATLASSLLFFVVTNFGVWAIQPIYPKTVAGLVACYVAAIPYFSNTLAGDAVYVTILFGALALAEKRFALLREPSLATSL